MKPRGIAKWLILSVCAFGFANNSAQGQLACVEAGILDSQQEISDTMGNLFDDLDADDMFGTSVASIGDINDDGIEDLVVGAPEDDTGGSNRGAVWILFMNPDGTVQGGQKIASMTGGFTGSLDDGDSFGSSVAGLGDFDNDGTPDIAVGAIGDDDARVGSGTGNNRGAVWLVFLRWNSGTQTLDVKSELKISDVEGNFGGLLNNNKAFGESLANIGDVNGDGVTDLAVGVPLDDDGGGFQHGAVWILFLNSGGWVNSEQKISDTQGSFLATLDDADRFGESIALLGDLDGDIDGVPEIIVGAPGDDDGFTTNSGVGAGAAYVLFLNSNGTVKSYQKISASSGGFGGTLTNDDRFGSSIAAAGDIDEDGTIDVIVGSRIDDDGGTQKGSAWAVFLNTDGTVSGVRKYSATSGGLIGLNPEDRFGTSAASLGDLDGDGRINVVVGAPDRDNGAEGETGGVFVLDLETCSSAGSPQGPPITSDPESVLVEYNFVSSTIVDFEVTAVGAGLVYQWRKDGIDLTDTGSILGSDTSSLSIGITRESPGVYDCVVMNVDGSTVSEPAVLGFYAPCGGDINGDGDTSTADTLFVIDRYGENDDCDE